MPLYTARCKSCKKEQDYYASMAECHNTPKCECGGETEKIISGNYHVVPDFEPYLDQNMAEKPVLVKSKKHRIDLMKRANVSERYGKGWF